VFEGSQAWIICPSDKSGIKTEISVKQWWNGTDRGKAEYWEKSLIQDQFVLYMYHVE